MMRWTLALGLTFLLSMVAWAAGPASLSTAGTVWTNKVVLPSGTTLHQGDRVETDRGSAAVIASRETGRVEVREQSSVSLGEGQVVLHQGVVATAKAAVQLDDIQIKPREAADALVVVAKRGEQILIAAHRGDAVISRPGAAPLLVPAGSYAIPAGESSDGGSNQAGANTSDDDDDDGGGAAQNGGWTIGSLSHSKSVAVVAGIGAAAVGGAVAGFALAEDSPSPSTR